MKLETWIKERAELLHAVECYENWIVGSKALIADGYKGQWGKRLEERIEQIAAELVDARRELAQHADFPGRDVIVIF